MFRFICYGVAGDSRSVQAAEEVVVETSKAASASSFSDDDRNRVACAVERWTAGDGHLRSGITMPEVAAETPETFFTHREACNPYYDAVPEVVEKYLGELSKITCREYHLFSYYGAEDADRMIILMGSATDAAREAIVPMWNKDRSNLFDFSTCLHRFPYTPTSVSLYENIVFPTRKHRFPYEKITFSL